MLTLAEKRIQAFR